MEEKYISSFDLSLCTRWWGEKPSIIILHGWLDQSASWDIVAQNLLFQGYGSVVPDHRGHGKSDHAPQNTHYHFPDYVADLSSLHWHINKRAPIILIGHSMGGTIASIYASLFPERVQKILLIEGLGPRSESHIQAQERYKKHILQREDSRPHKVFGSKEEAIHRYLQIHPSLSFERASSLCERILVPCTEGLRWRFDSRHKESSAISFLEERHGAILEGIQSPCSLIFGRESPYTSWVNIEKRSKQIPSLQKIYYIEGGHSPHLSHPIVLTNLLLQALQ